MDTRSFLAHLLPEMGVKFIAHLRPNKAGMIHVPVADVDEAADTALELDRTTANNVYFALATFKEVKYKEKNGFTSPVGRTQDNALRVKCLWQDWDVGKGNDNSYASREDALAGLKRYLKEVNLPAPLVVSSGYGIHTYWVFDACVPASEWEGIAQYQRIIMNHLGVKFDPSRDRDCASVLRPVGTHNKRNGNPPRLVKVVSTVPPTLPAEEYLTRLRDYCDHHGLMHAVKPTNAVPDYLRATGNLTGLAPCYPDSFAAIAVQHCKQLQNFAATGGAPEPLWYANLGVLKHCKDGEEYALLWSAAGGVKTPEQTLDKFNQWAAGPTTCARFQELAGQHCKDCPHKCKSPVQLGYRGEAETPTLEEAIQQSSSPPSDEAETPTIEEAAPAPPASTDDDPLRHLPPGYGFDGQFITRRVEDANGVWIVQQVASPLFWLDNSVELEDGSCELHGKLIVRGKVKSFQLQFKATTDKRVLKAALGNYGITIMSEQSTFEFVRTAALNLRRAKDALQTYQQMGWQHDFTAFLIGDTLITSRDERKIILGHRLKNKAASAIYGQSGSVQEWVDGIDALYNHPNAEPFQLAIGSAFGCILNRLLRYSEWNGIPLALTSDESGYGKSTVFQLANSIYYKQTNNSVVKDATVRAISARASQMGDLPVLMDEVTKYLTDPVDLSSVLYALSNGGDKIGCQTDGTEREAAPTWKLSSGMTGNKGVIHQLTESKLNPQATQMRVFEIDLDAYPRMALLNRDADAYKQHYGENNAIIQHLLENCYGVVGVEWIRWVMDNRERVEEKLRHTSLKMAKFIDGDATKERFYYHWIACTMTGLYFAKKLGYVRFNLNNLLAWAVKHVRLLRQHVLEYSDTPEDRLAALVASLNGKLLVTTHFDNLDGRAKHIEEIRERPTRSPVSGRFATGDDKERSKLYITTKAVSQWCREEGVSYNAFRRAALKAGVIRLGTKGCNRETGVVKVALGKGVPGYTHLGNPPCFEFDAELGAKALKLEDKAAAEVVPINRQQGGQ